MRFYLKNGSCATATVVVRCAFISEEQLKPFIFSATLTSKPIYKTNDYSELEIVWFGDDIKNLSISELVMNIKKFNWTELAQDFEF